MNFPKAISLTVTYACIAACGGSDGDSAGHDPLDSQLSAESMSEPDIELGGQFEIVAPAPFGSSSFEADLRCQDAFGGTPFHAIWTVSGSQIGIKVSGFRDPGGSPTHKIDTFSISTVEDGRQVNARLSDATLSTIPIGKSGAVTYYEVEATGTFVESGSFKASGKCRA